MMVVGTVYAGERDSSHAGASVEIVLDALRHPAPPVAIHRVLFAQGPVTIRSIQPDPFAKDGKAERVRLLSVGPSVILDGHARAIVLESDEPLKPGRAVMTGVFENKGDDTIRIRTDRKMVTLNPGKRLYIGTPGRLLRNPCGGEKSIPGSGRHCVVCRCECEQRDQIMCVPTVDADPGTDCNLTNGIACLCENGDEGVTSSCEKIYVPCEPPVVLHE
ncbi:MAG: hypothetical protein D6788_01520 [Planctomycetota bacterium]|nr:MAG: hypothetical protein D6788_01520 [Planctomycetota bacterium]